MIAKFKFDEMAVIGLSEDSGCDSMGTGSSGCDCDSPN